MTPKQVSKILQVNKYTVYNFIKQGRIKYTKTSTGRYSCEEESVNQVLATLYTYKNSKKIIDPNSGEIIPKKAIQYLLYVKYISDFDITYDQLAKEFNITRQRVEQIITPIKNQQQFYYKIQIEKLSEFLQNNLLITLPDYLNNFKDYSILKFYPKYKVFTLLQSDLKYISTKRFSNTELLDCDIPYVQDFVKLWTNSTLKIRFNLKTQCIKLLKENPLHYLELTNILKKTLNIKKSKFTILNLLIKYPEIFINCGDGMFTTDKKYSSKTTKNLILEYWEIYKNSDYTKIKEYVMSKRLVKESSVYAYYRELINKGEIV